MLASILLFCLLSRLGWVLHLEDTAPSRTLSNDSWSYLYPARFLVGTGHFPATLFLRTPGYPALIAGVFAIRDSETAFLIVQVLLSCATVLACYFVASRLWGPTTGLVAAGLLAVEPLQFVASGSVLTESVSSLALLAIVGLGFRVFGPSRRSSPLWSGLLGLALAIATLIRPTTYYFPLFVLVLLAVRAVRRWSPRQIAVVAAFLMPIVVLVGGWQLRNHERVNSWRFSGIEAENMSGYRAAGVIAWRDGVGLKTAQHRVDPEGGHPPTAARALGPYYEKMLAHATDIVLHDPVALGVVTARGLAAGVFGPGTKYVGLYTGLGSSQVVTVSLLAWLLCFYAALAWGIARVLRHDRTRLLGHIFAWGTVTYVFVASAGPETNARFRAPLMPVLAIYAAYGLVAAAASRARRRSEHPPVP
jgi:4-amino-4-deoxy-L-arabinose transferase-like glycosyltransferase